LAVDEHIKKEKEIQNSYFFSFTPFMKNELHVPYNYPQYKITYLDEDEKLTTKNSIDDYQSYIENNGIQPTDLVCCVPPCGGLSLLNTGNRGADAPQNDWIYECVKWFIAQKSKVLVLENAPGLVSDTGAPVLQNIKNICGKDYKVHAIKTSTIHHGLPQDRVRTLLFVYKRNNHVILNGVNRPFELLEQFLKRPEKYSNKNNHVTIETNYSKMIFEFIVEKGLIEEFREIAKNKTFYMKPFWPVMIERYKIDNQYFNGYDKLKGEADYKLKKLSVGKGYWDSSPLFVKGKTNAVISKNTFRTLHPKFYRYLSVREFMDLMGMPDQFQLFDGLKSYNHIAQAVPVNTAADGIRWAIKIIDNELNELPNNVNILIQKNNSNIPTEKELYEVRNNSIIKIEKGFKPKAFF